MAKRSAIWLQEQCKLVGTRLLRVGLLLVTGSMLIPIGGGVVSESVAQQASLREDSQDRLSDEEMALILASEKHGKHICSKMFDLIFWEHGTLLVEI